MDPKDYFVVGAAIASVAVSVFTLVRARMTSVINNALMEKRIGDLESASQKQEAALQGLKTGLDLGIGKVQDSLAELGRVLAEVRSDVKVLYDRDERDHPVEPKAKPTPRGRTTRS